MTSTNFHTIYIVPGTIVMVICTNYYLSCNNTWINKSRDWHIDGVANKSSVWFFMSSDVWSTSYNDLSDASLDILKTMDSKQFHMLIYHCFLMKKKTQCKLKNGLKSTTGTLLHQKQPFLGGMLSLNLVVQTLKMLNAPAGQMRYLHWKP